MAIYVAVGIASYLALVGEPEIKEIEVGKPDIGKNTCTQNVWLKVKVFRVILIDLADVNLIVILCRIVQMLTFFLSITT